MEETHITIIGAGVIGLAIAAELSLTRKEILLLEKHESFGQETSSRNSEVIHAGIYYPQGTLKASLCVEGMELLYSYCRKLSIPHKQIGKLIVAVDNSETGQLMEVMENGKRNGVESLSLVDSSEAKRKEQKVNAVAAVYSPCTGIIDSHAYMKSLYNSARSRGVFFSFGSEVDSLNPEKNGFVIGVKGEPEKIFSRIVINSAGLASDNIAGMAGIDPDDHGYRLDYCKGSYFTYSKSSPVGMLVYPVPQHNLSGLGVHATLDLGGRLRFGPDVEYVKQIDYVVDHNKKSSFYKGASKIIRGLDENAFNPDMAGVRPKIKGEGVKDFIIHHEADRGMNGLINLIGIESPGLTASLAIARHVEKLIKNFME
jgi:L-2-hydroxyglutarate oxidase LhgO